MMLFSPVDRVTANLSEPFNSLGSKVARYREFRTSTVTYPVLTGERSWLKKDAPNQGSEAADQN